jgi:threonine dehydrogenase-like Zn-dependent dehydrogenase
VPADRFALRDLELIGSVGYTTAVWTRVVELLGAGLVDLGPVVARRIPAERFEDAFRLMGEADGVVGRILLEHAIPAPAPAQPAPPLSDRLRPAYGS